MVDGNECAGDPALDGNECAGDPAADARKDRVVPDDRSDGALAIAVARGDGDAYAQLYRRHSVSVVATVRMFLGNGTVCDDVTAEVFLGFWISPKAFDPDRGSLRGYLRMKARTRSIDLLRAEASRKRREGRAVLADPDVDAGIDDGLLASENRAAVRAAVDRLPSGERQAIQLAYFDGLSYRAVAAQLRVAEGTVKSRIRTGLRRLRDAAEGWDPPEHIRPSSPSVRQTPGTDDFADSVRQT